MDHDATQPINTARTVVYRCPCGNQLTLAADTGGQCDQCQRVVSARSLAFDLGSTTSLEEHSFELAQTQANLPEGHVPEVILTDDDQEVRVDVERLVGKRFGHFEIISPLGRGGMGQVYRALDTSLQRYVAVKVLRSGITGGEDGPSSSTSEIDKLLQEAISQARVPHPNIVTIYYVGKEDGNPFLAMELVNGLTLNRRIAKGDLSFEETASIGLQIASALQASLELDIIHGDIKPSNVLLAKDGTAKLSDFGMARSASEDKSVAAGGTPNYLAPELLKGTTTSPQSDMYALGVTLYEMTFGELPIELRGSSIRKWIEAHESTEVEFPADWPPDVPRSWRDLLSRMLAKDPDGRYASYDELLSDMRRLQPHSDVSARFFPRLIAAGVDWASVLLLTIGFQTALVFFTRQQIDPSLGLPNWLPYMIGVLTFLPIFAYTMIVYFWRQTIGRSLMHLKVVNQFGLRPSGRQMAVRSLLRMQFPWIVIFMTLLIGTQLEVIGYSGYVVSGVFLLMDIVYMLLTSNGRSFHDLFARTQVVLDTSELKD